MKNFNRTDKLFSLCGLNCGLCPMRIDHYCPGCGGGEGNQSCNIAACSLEKGGLEYCFHCIQYPCKRYDGIDEYDSFITHFNQRLDIYKAQKIGLSAYLAEQAQKVEALKLLLSHYNDGRRKRFFCLAVNLLELDDILDAMEAVDQAGEAALRQTGTPLTLKERATQLCALLTGTAEGKGIVLKLRKKGS